MSKLTIIADSTQIKSYIQCPQEWYYSYRLNIQSGAQPVKDALVQGTYGHKLLEIFYKARANGKSLVDSMEEAVSHDVDKDTNCKCGHAASSHSKITLGQTVLETCRLCSGTTNYQHTFDPQPFPLLQPLRLVVQEKFRTHCLLYSNKDVRPHGPETVEVGFSEQIYEDSEHLFVLEGKIDLLGKLEDSNMSVIVDHKFQSYERALYNKSIQFRNYAMITDRKLLGINYIRLGKYPKSPFYRDWVPFGADEHQWWKKELVKIFKAMSETLKTANQFGTVTEPGAHRWASCEGQWGYCQFHDLCEEREVERAKFIKIQNNFIKKEEWKPW